MKKIKRIICIIILAMIVLTAGNIQANSQQTQLRKSSTLAITLSIDCFEPVIRHHEGYASIQLSDATGYHNIPGEPILPVYIRTLELPFGASIKDISCVLTTSPETQLTQKITPAARPAPTLTNPLISPSREPSATYTKNQFYPEEWFSYRLTGGLNVQDILTTFLTIQVNPVRYNPIQDVIQSISSITIKVIYEQPTNLSSSSTDSYDLLIICKDSYAPLLEPLVTHKNIHEIQTKLITISNITKETYFPLEGRDLAEQIKYFIKHAKESWNISYVMLVGNYAQVPIRYASLETDVGGAYQELKFVSDLYYADLYTANGSFSSWDTDNDGLYAEWPYPESHAQDDLVDLVPDVHVGRLACMFKSEVRTMVNKIITYETTAAGQDWFNRMVVIGGDTFDKIWEVGTDYNEGEVATQKALDYMPQFHPIKLWTTLGNLTTGTIHEEISQGCGFLYFCGHGSPKSWATHNNSDYVNWTGYYKNMDMPKLSNKGMPPILMIGGCHNSELDTTPKNLFIGILTEGKNYFTVNDTWLGSYWKYNYALECWSWVFVKVKGGAIASIGSSGYGGVNIGDSNHDDIPDCIQGLDGWFETEFFRLYNQENITVLGQTYDQVLTGYVQNFPVATNRYDAKILETHILLGDPSLKIGGYD